MTLPLGRSSWGLTVLACSVVCGFCLSLFVWFGLPNLFRLLILQSFTFACAG